MFLRKKIRTKNGKAHEYWSVVENQRIPDGRVVQRQVLYLGELNGSQTDHWNHLIKVFDDSDKSYHQVALLQQDQVAPESLSHPAINICLDQMQLHNPRQWGGCWLALQLWDVLELDRFWQPLLSESRQGTRWLNVLKALTVYRMIDPGSEWRFHREWFSSTAMADLLGENFALAQKDKLYRCLDKVLPHKEALFDFLKDRWNALFSATFDVLLYDLTSTYFECDPPEAASNSKKAYGYSRDHRPDCVQVVVALVVTPEGLPLAYEVFKGNTRDTATLEEFLKRIESRYGTARRTWLMDRGIPTEETLAKMRDSGVSYLVGTPKGRLTKLEKELLNKSWSQARSNVRVKVMQDSDQDFYVLVESGDRVNKERSMRQRRLRALLRTLHQLKKRKSLTHDQLLMALGAAKHEAGRAWSLVDITHSPPGTAGPAQDFEFRINRQKLREARQREGRYLLRSNEKVTDPAKTWENYLLLTQIEQAFKDLKGDLGLRPIWHQLDDRIEAHILVCFLAYCLHTTLRNLTREKAGGLTPAQVIEKLSRISMIDVHFPTTDDRTLILTRYTQPSPEAAMILASLKLELPEQPPPKIHANQIPCSADF